MYAKGRLLWTTKVTAPTMDLVNVEPMLPEEPGVKFQNLPAEEVLKTSSTLSSI
jgi:hypothetical protein